MLCSTRQLLVAEVTITHSSSLWQQFILHHSSSPCITSQGWEQSSTKDGTLFECVYLHRGWKCLINTFHLVFALRVSFARPHDLRKQFWPPYSSHVAFCATAHSLRSSGPQRPPLFLHLRRKHQIFVSSHATPAILCKASARNPHVRHPYSARFPPAHICTGNALAHRLLR